jgi:hypothetical protein
MDLTVKLLSKLPEVKGTSQKGEWKKQDCIFVSAEQFPKKVCISFWENQVEKIQAVSDGSTLQCHINIESREYNGKYYTDVRCWKFDVKSKPEPQSHKSANWQEPEPIENQHELPPF